MRGLYQNNFIPAIVLFAVGVSVFVILFFYSTGFYLIKHPTFENLNGVTVTLTAIMLLLTIAFVFIVGWLAKRYFIKEVEESLELSLTFKSITDNMGDGVITLDKNGVITFANTKACIILGYSQNELVGENAHSLIHYETKDGRFVSNEECPTMKKLKENLEYSCEDDTYIKKDKSKIDVAYKATPLIVNGATKGSIILFSDITEKKKNIKKLKLSDTIVKNIHEGVIVADKYGDIVFANNFIRTVTGYTPEELIGENPKILKSGKHDEKFYEAMWERINKDGCWQGEIWNKRKDGEVYAEWITITAVTAESVYYVAVFSDITDKKLQEMELVKAKELFELQATYDGMTKLYNRQKTEDILKIEIDRSRRYGIELSVLMLDIDDFKKINDTYGHPTGDTVLREISRLIRKCIRKTDYAGRWGGEEFIVIAPHTDLKGASVFAESIREIVEATDFAGVGRVTCSIGATYFQKTDNEESVVKRADEALYESKKDGKNRVTIL